MKIKKPLKFGQDVICCEENCASPVHKYFWSLPFCYVHYPKVVKLKIGKYSGKSQTPYGQYENR